MLQMPSMINITIAAAIASFLVSVLIVVTQGWHGRLSLDKDVTGVQKFHVQPVPRVGGIALMGGILAAVIIGALWYPYSIHRSHAFDLILLVLAAMPAFAAGLIEDLTKKVSIKTRLLATMGSALLASWLLKAYLPRVDIWGVDDLLEVLPVAIIVTAIAVCGVTNSINIIDGFHGLAGSTVVIILAGMAFLTWKSGDIFILKLTLLGIGATVGFLLVNYPTGRLFMGDGGAYFIGFWVAEIAVLTIVRNPGINAWQVLAIYAYPVTEVLFSMYRKKVIRKMSPGVPDRVHLHMLIYRRVVCQIVPRTSKPWIRNAAVACITAVWVGLTTAIAVGFGNTIVGGVALVIFEVFLYMAIYTRLVRGRWCLDPAVVFGLRAQSAGAKL